MKQTNLLKLKLAAAFTFTLAFATNGLFAQEAATDEKAQAAELAKKLQNPVASLISVPIQNNWDFGYGPAKAMRYTANVQPVIPIALNKDWNLITRTILPIVYAESPVIGGPSKFGLGDTVQSFFFSPKAPTSSGWIWGAGPVALWPTSTDDALGAGKVGAGPTALVLKQGNGWTYGLLANHLWSYAGQGSSADVNATFIQPVVSYTLKTFTTFGLNTESTYDWSHRQWTVPLNVSVSQLVKIGGQPVQFSLGAKYYADKPKGGPDWGLRFAVTFLFPKCSVASDERAAKSSVRRDGQRGRPHLPPDGRSPFKRRDRAPLRRPVGNPGYCAWRRSSRAPELSQR